MVKQIAPDERYLFWIDCWQWRHSRGLRESFRWALLASCSMSCQNILAQEKIDHYLVHDFEVCLHLNIFHLDKNLDYKNIYRTVTRHAHLLTIRMRFTWLLLYSFRKGSANPSDERCLFLQRFVKVKFVLIEKSTFEMQIVDLSRWHRLGSSLLLLFAIAMEEQRLIESTDWWAKSNASLNCRRW